LEKRRAKNRVRVFQKDLTYGLPQSLKKEGEGSIRLEKKESLHEAQSYRRGETVHKGKYQFLLILQRREGEEGRREGGRTKGKKERNSSLSSRRLAKGRGKLILDGESPFESFPKERV